MLLSSLGFNAAGEVLNCQSFDVALATAIDLKTDKLIVMTDPSRMPYEGNDDNERVPRYLALRSTESMLAKTYAAKGAGNERAHERHRRKLEMVTMNCSIDGSATNEDEEQSASSAFTNDEREHLFDRMRGVSDNLSRFEELMERGLTWRVPRCPQELCLATFACKAGVRRAHLVDPTVSGSLLVELYTETVSDAWWREIATRGVRGGHDNLDFQSIKRILEPLVEDGAVISRSDEDLIDEVCQGYFPVTERDGKGDRVLRVKPCGSDENAHEIATCRLSGVSTRGPWGRAPRIRRELRR